MFDDDVLAQAAAFVERCAAAPDQHRLLETALRGRAEELRQHPVTPADLDCVYVPRWVYAAVSGDDAPSLHLAAAAFLLWAGIDLLDAVMDGDPLPGWEGHRPAEVSLAAMTLSSAAAPLALLTLDAPPATLIALQQTLFQGLLEMSAGQQQDLAMAGGASATAAAVEASVTGKSGAGLAMLAALAARFAGASDEEVEAYAEFGRALGTARQLKSDCQDIFFNAESKDLTNGTRTLPVALRLDQLADDERDAFVALLHQARIDPAASDTVRANLRKVGVLQACARVINLRCEHARQALARASPHQSAAEALHHRIDDASLSIDEVAAQEGGEEPMASQAELEEFWRDVERLYQKRQTMNGGGNTHDTRAHLHGATATAGVDYDALIKKVAADPKAIKDLREGVALLKGVLGESVMDIYVLTVIFKKIDWAQGERTLQGQAFDKLEKGVIW